MRTASYLEHQNPSILDRFGRWLSQRRLHCHLNGASGLVVADIGCGFEAALTAPFASKVDRLILVDVSLNEALATADNTQLILGQLPAVLEQIDDATVDLVICNNVVEHVWEDQRLLNELHRIVKPGGRVCVNVPSWLGKWALEFCSFRLGLVPVAEIEDHKRYYDPRELWPLLVAAGFKPSKILCFRHKFWLNTYATAIRDPEPE
ncbi:MAG: class I SAM-dependent methyltransferase [Pseudomonadota bacterium]